MRLLQHRAKVSERVAWRNKLWLARPDACCVKGAPEDQSGATAADRKRRRQFQSVMGVTVMGYNDGQRQRQTGAGGKAERVTARSSKDGWLQLRQRGDDERGPSLDRP